MKKSEAINQLVDLMRTLSWVELSKEAIAKRIIEECENFGMLPPGKDIQVSGMNLKEHTWDNEE